MLVRGLGRISSVASDPAKAGSETVQAEWPRESARMAQTRRMEKATAKGVTIQCAEVFALPLSGLAGALAFKGIPLRTGLLLSLGPYGTRKSRSVREDSRVAEKLVPPQS